MYVHISLTYLDDMLRDRLRFMPEDGTRAICENRTIFSFSMSRLLFIPGKARFGNKTVRTIIEGRIPIIGTRKLACVKYEQMRSRILNQFPIIFGVKIDEKRLSNSLWQHVSINWYWSRKILFSTEINCVFEEMPLCFLCQFILKYRSLTRSILTRSYRTLNFLN